MKNWRDLIVSQDMSLLDVLKILEEKGTQFVIVVENNNKAVGVITDGDVRRGLMKKFTLNESCKKFMNSNFFYLIENNIKKEELDKIRESKIKYIPILNADHELVEVRNVNELDDCRKRDNRVLILAGGLGSRLGNLTKTCPKPLLKIGDKPILENIITSLKKYGFYDIVISINYLSEMIVEYFGDGSKWGVKISYVKEDRRLGTAGPLSLLPTQSPLPLLVLNGDLITKINFGALIDFHEEHSNLATMCIRQHEEKIAYGVVEFENQSLIRIDEKPVKFHYVNAGIYVFSSNVFDYVPSEVYFDMNNLFENLLQHSERVGVFPIHEYWVDIGKFDDLQKAREDHS